LAGTRTPPPVAVPAHEDATMALRDVTLDDKYEATSGEVYLTGIQALVRLLLDQRRRDRGLGLDTAGFVSGYRGSPLGSLDQNLWRAAAHLEAHDIRFQPGLNEDLAATAVWGTQQVGLFPGARHAGVFGMWYGKAPGVDRSGDVFKHANMAGTAPLGGVLAVAGDDHGCKSSTLPSQSEYAFMDAQMPVLHPADAQEILDLGLLGYAMSRYSGLWVGFKAIADNVDTSASVRVDPDRLSITTPQDLAGPADGLHIRWPDPPLAQEQRLQRHRLYAALAFARANRVDRVVVDSPQPRLGIVTTGKAYLDVMQALDDLRIDAALAADIGLRVYKVGMVWPLERDGIRAFARGLEEILVVEEKRAVIENQVKEQLYNWDEAVRPRVVGKFDENGEWVLPSAGELTPARIARVIAMRIGRYVTSRSIEERLKFLEDKEAALAEPRPVFERLPHYCSGCPHNTSTVVPEGSRALGGIGCHYMATWMGRHTDTFSQMGGEGVAWLGQAPFTDTRHVFANLGDGTYFHSGLLAIRAAVAAKVNLTYKLLYNDAVAMTGGQPLDGTLTVPDITRQLEAEGVARIAVVTDEPGKYPREARFAPGVQVHHRDALESVQRELRATPGVTVLVYDQTCAAQKRRQRKRGSIPDPAVRAFIHEDVCEGCGDCSVQSNCLSIVPLDTAFGRKRAVDQHSCNKDLSCLRGLCPSFVTVRGGRLRRRQVAPEAIVDAQLPDPEPVPLEEPWNVLVTGVGGTGVVTVGALLGMAAHVEGRGVSVLDMTGLAQKFGAVTSHVRIAARQERIHARRISAGGASLLLGCDLAVAAGYDALSKCNPAQTHAVVNVHRAMPSSFIQQPDQVFPTDGMRACVESATRPGGDYLDAGTLAARLCGDALAANLLLLGVAWQRGLVPLSRAAIERAIAVNGVAVESNLRAFTWGRLFAVDPARVLSAASPAAERRTPRTLDEVVAHRAAHLERYQDAAYAARYRERVAVVHAAEEALMPGSTTLALAAAEGYAKLLAYKDEYEVARLYTEPTWRQRLDEQFEGAYRVEFHMAPPLLSRPDPATGRPRKRAFGGWLARLFPLLAACRRLRGTPLDPFGRRHERRMERALIRHYEALMERVLANLDARNHSHAVALLDLPRGIRGFGPVKARSISAAKRRESELMAAFLDPPGVEAA
jgi:indolepyruvate ferredoxin oxidoreductase